MLKELFDKYGCDKAKKHHYHEVYEREFEPLRWQPINILEVGIFKGDSMSAWHEYFPRAQIYGIDVFKRVHPSEIPILKKHNVHYLKGDSTNAAIREQIKKQWPRLRFDIIIDDGLHTPDANAKTLANLYPLLKKTGKYFVEDVWPLDIMTMEEMNHQWVRRHPDRYNILEMEKFNRQLERKKVKKFDLRSKSGEPDSYIVRVE